MLATCIQKWRMFCWRSKGYDIHPSTTLERNLKMDKLNPKGIHIGKDCLIASGCTILSHDHCKRTGPNIVDCWLTDTYIGDRCFLGMNCTILPGVSIGDECIVGTGAVVTKNVPANCIVAGNPAKIIRSDVKLGKRGIILNWTPEKGWN